MADEEKKEKKIIIDEDWKAQAQKEKEQLDAEQQKADTAGASELPPADFMALVSLLATQAFLALGLIRTKEDADVKPDFNLAKFNIDMLAVIREKTEGNLSDEEKKILDDTIHQLRMAFVKLSQ